MQPDKIHRTLLGAAAVFIAFGLQAAKAAEITLTINGVESAQGRMMIAVYDSEAAFDKTDAVRAMSIRPVAGSMTVPIADLEPGEYAVMLFHDVDGNEKLDTNMLGMPREPWGGSLEGKSVFGAPGWDDTRFSLGADGRAVRIDLN